MDPSRLASQLTPWLGAGSPSASAYTAVADGVRGLALDGRLPAGTRVPSERALAAALGVSRTTVSAAYDVLRSEGYLRSAHGAGSRVALPLTAQERPDVDPRDPREPDGVRDLTMAALPAPAAVLDAVAAAGADLPQHLAHHGMHAFGLPVLRAAVAEHLSRRGLPTRVDQVLVTGGALQGWNLLLRALAVPGQRAVVEQPTYPAVVDAVRAHHLRPVALPVGDAGWELPTSATNLRALTSAVLAHVTPDAQNPTGLVLDDDARAGLLRALAATSGAAGGGPVVAVDETFADLVDPAVAQTPLGALGAPTGTDVVTLGSMSKSFWAGLRIGWVRTSPDLVARLAQVRAGLDITSPVLDQLVAVHLLARAPEVLAERRALLVERQDALLAALAAGVPDWTVRPAQAGLVLWVGLPTPSATQLVAHALDLGVRLVPGPRFTVDGTGDRWLRLPLTAPPEDAPGLVAVLREARSRALSSVPTSRTPARWTA